MTTGQRDRPKAFADLWDMRGTPRPPTTIANPLGLAAREVTPLSERDVMAARGVDRRGGIDLSADGTEVAFAWDTSGELEIYAAPIFGDRIIQLTEGNGRSSAPRWSPDARWIAFTRERDGRPELWVVDRDGEHEHRVDPGDHLHGKVTLEERVPRWSADTASPLLAAAGAKVVPGSARWSPDGSWIAFTTPHEGMTKIAFAAVRDGAVTRTQVLAAGTPHADDAPVWRPDGRGVVYRRRERGGATLHRVFTVSHADDVVLDLPGWLFSPQVGADSETIVAVLVDADGADVVVRPKGATEVVRITRSAAARG